MQWCRVPGTQPPSAAALAKYPDYTAYCQSSGGQKSENEVSADLFSFEASLLDM